MWPFKTKETAPKVVQQAAGGTIGGLEPRPVSLPAKPIAKHQTTADVLDFYCQKHKATYERSISEGGKIRIRVHMPDGDVLAGQGATTLDAVTVVIKKMEAA